MKISFEYEPDEDRVDTDDPSGVTEDEFVRVTDTLSQEFGAENLDFVAKT